MELRPGLVEEIIAAVSMVSSQPFKGLYFHERSKKNLVNAYLFTRNLIKDLSWNSGPEVLWSFAFKKIH